MNAINIHDNSTNEREVRYYSPECKYVILDHGGDLELWEACYSKDPRKGLRVGIFNVRYHSKANEINISIH